MGSALMTAAVAHSATSHIFQGGGSIRSVNPLLLRQIKREHVHYFNKICTVRPPLAFSWLSKPWRLEISPIEHPQLAYSEQARVDWGGAEIILRIEPSLVAMALSGVLQTDSAGSLTGEVRNLLIDAAFMELTEFIESHFRKRFRLVSTEDERAESSIPSFQSKNEGKLKGWLLVFSDGTAEYRCEAWIDDLALGFFADAVRAWPTYSNQPGSWGSLPIPVMICAGWTTVALPTLRQLRLNDVILMDECLINQHQREVLIRFGNRFGIRGELLQSSIKVTDFIEEIMDDIDEFNEPLDDDHPLDQDDGDIEQIPVRLYFDLGERMVTLAELKTVAPGYIFELGREPRRAVTIRVNGKKIGEGELVEIDGNIGVSILAIHSSSH
jgi:type III secretion protein Q